MTLLDRLELAALVWIACGWFAFALMRYAFARRGWWDSGAAWASAFFAVVCGPGALFAAVLTTWMLSRERWR